MALVRPLLVPLNGLIIVSLVLRTSLTSWGALLPTASTYAEYCTLPEQMACRPFSRPPLTYFMWICLVLLLLRIFGAYLF